VGGPDASGRSAWDAGRREQTLQAREVAILRESGDALVLALEAHPQPYLWRSDPATGTFEGVAAHPDEAAPASLPGSVVRRALDPGGFVAVCEPERDPRLAALLPALPQGSPSGALAWQRVAFRLGSAAEPLGLFLLLVPPPNRLSYTLARQAAAMLATTISRPVRESRRLAGLQPR
jgi:hypothetical protein